MQTPTAVGKFVKASGHRTNLHQQGHGAPVVLLHGSGPGVSAWANWNDVLPSLADRFSVLAPDIAGFGYTENAPDVPLNIKTWVNHLIAILDVCQIEKASIVGNSFGGGLALATALSHSDRIDKLVLLGTPCGEFEMTEPQKAGWYFEPSLAAMAAALKVFAYNSSCITDEMVRVRHEASSRPGAQDAYRRLFPKPNESGPTLVRGVPESALRNITQPTLILHGRDDEVIPLDIGIRLFRSVPDAELHAFGKCGHWVQIERRKEFVRLVTDFLLAK